MIIAHHDDNDDTKHVSFVLSCPSIVAPHVLGFWGVGSEGYYFLGERWVRTWSIHFDSGFQHLFNQFFSNWEAKFMLHFFTAILRITFMASRILKNLFVNQFCWGRWGNLWMTVARIVAELLLPEVWCSCHGSSDFGRRLFQLCVATLLQRCQLCCLLGIMCLPKVGFGWVDEWFFSQLIFFCKRKFRQVRFYWAWKEFIERRPLVVMVLYILYELLIMG